MASQRTLTWWETPRDLAVLAETRFNFHISFQIEATSTNRAFNNKPNIVYRALAPSQEVTKIQWQPRYALSFAQDLPPLDSIVYLSTPWQPCAKGETYDLGTSGFFSKTHSMPGGSEALGVVNRYPIGLHFVVGVYSEDTGRYEPIFVDPARVEPGHSVSYRPTGKATWWLDRSFVSGSFFDGHRKLGVSCSWDLEGAANECGGREVQTSFDLAEGRWTVEEKAPGS